MENTNQNEEKIEQAMELLNTEEKIKYPKGSFIVFSGNYKKGEKNIVVSCAWYDKVGGKKPLKNIVSNPPEWQNMPYEEAKKIWEMFDDHICLNMVFV